MTTDKNLSLIESELRFIGRHVQAIEGASSEDLNAVDEIGLAVSSALRALHEYKLSVQPNTTEATPAGVSEPDADTLPVAA